MTTTPFSVFIRTDISEPSFLSDTPIAFHTLCGVPMYDWVRRACIEAGAETVTILSEGDSFKKTEEQAVILPANIPLITPRELQFFVQHETASVAEFPRDADTFFVCDRDTLNQAEEQLRKRIIRKHQQNGVTVRIPETVTIGPDVIIGQDTVIEGGCTILGNTTIGKACTIGAFTELSDMTVGDRVKIRQSVLELSTIGSDTTVGPFAYVRPHSQIGEQVRIGDFVEIKNSVIGSDTKISHLTYVGDSDVGDDVNFGCGTVTANYDGKNKHRTTIGNGAFIGCNTNLIAPVTIGDGAMTAAGSTITDPVPDGALAIARERQINKLKRSPFRID